MRYHLKSKLISTHQSGIILNTWNILTIFWFPFHYLPTNAKFPQNENILGLKKILGLIELISKPKKKFLVYIAQNEHAFLILAFLLTQRRQGRFILKFFLFD